MRLFAYTLVLLLLATAAGAANNPDPTDFRFRKGYIVDAISNAIVSCNRMTATADSFTTGVMSMYEVEVTATTVEEIEAGILIKQFTSADNEEVFSFSPVKENIRLVVDTPENSNQAYVNLTCSHFGATGANVDNDNDGLFEFVNADSDWDGDGTTWQTCDCGGGTTPDFAENYICGTYRTSLTDDTPVDYSSDDYASNPAECRFEGERIWDDITDDIKALESRLTTGSMVYFPPGIYPMKGANPTTTTLCWNSTTKTWASTCPLEGPYSTSAVLMRKDGLKFVGGGADGNGEKDLQREGTWMVQNRGLLADWPSTPATLPRSFCMGYYAASVQGSCGYDLFQGTGSADVLVSIESGSCLDQNDTGTPQTTGVADGLCDFDGATARVDTEVAARNELCIDDAAGFASGLSAGDLIALTTLSVAGQNTRTFHRINSVGAACGAGSAGLAFTLGDTQMLEDLGDAFNHPQDVPGQVFGADSAIAAEAARASLVQGPIDPEYIVSGLVIEDFTFAHHNYVGDGVCTDGTQAACDEGSLVAADSGRNNIIQRIAVVHANPARGSGGAIDSGPFNLGMKIRDSVFRHNGGGALIDVSTGVLIKNNVFEDNTNFKGAATFNTYMIGNQGGFMVVDQNVFQRNHIVDDEGRFSGLLALGGPFSYVTRNQFLSSDGPCVRVLSGMQWGFITDNIFQCGDLIGTDDQRADIFIGGNITQEATEFIDISRNMFLAGGSHSSDAGETIKILIGGDNDTVVGRFGPGGIHIHDNMVNVDSALSSFVGFRAVNNADTTNVFLNGNILSQGKLAVQIGFGTAGWFNLTTTPICGWNKVGGSIVGAVANQCSAGWTIP